MVRQWHGNLSLKEELETGWNWGCNMLQTPYKSTPCHTSDIKITIDSLTCPLIPFDGGQLYLRGTPVLLITKIRSNLLDHFLLEAPE